MLKRQAVAIVKTIFRSGREMRDAMSFETLDALSLHLESLIVASRRVVASSHAILEASG